MGQQFEQQTKVADQISNALHQDNTDASQKMYSEVMDHIKPIMSDTTSRQNLSDHLILTNDIWHSTQMGMDSLFIGGGTTVNGLKDLAKGVDINGNPVDAATSLAAQGLLDANSTGILGDINGQLNAPYVVREVQRLAEANTALNAVNTLSEARFNELAGDNKELSAGEITQLLAEGKISDPNEKKVLQDLLTDMNGKFGEWGLHENWYGENMVTYAGLSNTVNNVFAHEVDAIKAMQRDATAEIKDGDLTPVAPALPTEVPNTSFAVRPGDGFDRIARQVLTEKLGQRPSAADEILLSNYIASLNQNDRKYSNGILKIGQTIQVPDFSQADVQTFMEELRKAS